MVYKNFWLRIFISLVIFISYFSLSIYSFENVVFFIAFIYIIIVIEIIINFNKLKYIIIIYIILSFISLIYINFDQNNLIKFNLFISIIILFDSFSYIFGKLFGKKKIVFLFSPNKTFEGLFGGFLSSLIISLIYCYYFNLPIKSSTIVFIILIIISSFCGDMIESFFKRKNDLKNSSNFLPGHGGFFDRFDSLIFSIFIYNQFNYLL